MCVNKQMQDTDKLLTSIQGLFKGCDTNGDGKIDLNEFLDQMAKPEFSAFAATLDLDVSDLQMFFQIVSNDGAVPVDLRTFTTGCTKLRGTARSMDIQALLCSQTKLAEDHLN